jgi:hypothetical protein
MRMQRAQGIGPALCNEPRRAPERQLLLKNISAWRILKGPVSFAGSAEGGGRYPALRLLVKP